MTTLEKDLFKFYTIAAVIISIILCFCVVAFAEEINFDKLLVAVVQVESSGRPYVVSKAGAVGLAQITPIVIKEYQDNGGNLTLSDMFVPEHNLTVAKWYLLRLYHYYKCDTIEKIAMAYNFGITRCKRNNFDLSKTCRETRNYVKKVRDLYDRKGDIE